MPIKNDLINSQKEDGHDFFLVVPIGLEEAAQIELTEWCGVLSTEFGKEAFLFRSEIVKGGVEFRIGSPQVAFLLNACLKLASRILQRIHVFQTRDWGVLEKELKTISWKNYFSDGILKWEISASESRMNNEKHLAQFLEEKFENKFYFIKPGGSAAYLRVHDNVFTLSRDTSGEHLHFRGYRKHQGEAPLRENLSAFLWYFLIRNHSCIETEKTLIIDPFVGSGTVLAEALLWNQIIENRSFPAWNWVSKQYQSKFALIQKRLRIVQLNLLGIDNNDEVLEKAKMNLESIHTSAAHKVKLLSGDSTNPNSDLLNEITKLNRNNNIWLISNPPYGGKGRLQSQKTWKTLWTEALIAYQPQWALALGPERECKKNETFSSWTCVDTQKFLNGGIRVVASLWKKENK